MIKGMVIFQMANKGSKSEGMYPFLRLEDGTLVKIAYKGDNPFENTTLKGYELKCVALEGELNENGKFIATEIREILASDEATVSPIDEVAETEENI